MYSLCLFLGIVYIKRVFFPRTHSGKNILVHTTLHHRKILNLFLSLSPMFPKVLYLKISLASRCSKVLGRSTQRGSTSTFSRPANFNTPGSTSLPHPPLLTP
ncbi:hypothetical protein GDO81_014122 [Engystomops pustulosus]|uniref:Uncharacterized protein n=1 Tax=Engystomops pustulosus TaxID=76066 RepID=A0AAV7B818_ENGPU|nr:hypothetical protein GDO81_014122 [Engystomops pustulosus]